VSRRAIFMDRDGTICEEVGYVNHVSRSRLLPGSLEAIRLANAAGYLVVVATNQSGVARGLFDEALVVAVHRALADTVAAGGGRLDALYFCPHHPREGQPPYRAECDCRKPRPGMLERAAREHDIDLTSSWMIGDSLYGRGLVEHQPHRFRVRAPHTADDLLGAVRWILAREAPQGGTGR
jgi:D-glycero-D-manno-heptose 1,7-bisphosphate phosphatase